MALIICIIAVLASVFTAGCRSNADPEAREVIDEAHGHLELAAAEFENIDALNTQAKALLESGYNEDTARKQEMFLVQFKTGMEKALEEISKAKALFEKALNMNVSEEMQKYLKMKIDALWEQEQALEIQIEAMTLRFELFNAQASEGISMEQIAEYSNRLGEMDEETSSHLEKSAAKNRDANDFYKEKNLDK